MAKKPASSKPNQTESTSKPAKKEPLPQLNIDLFRRLCETPGVPGREERVRALLTSEIKGLFDSVEEDALGNLICVRKPTKKSSRPTRVMVLAHMDEIGFYVCSIDDKGFIYVNPAGGFDARNLFSRRVLLCAKGGDIKGVMNPGGRPVHIATPEERAKVPMTKEFFVDIGLDADEVKAKVRIGDYVVMDEPFIEVGNKVVSKALDNRFACWTAVESVRKLAKDATPHTAEITVVFTTQEEVGLRGARTSSYRVKPDIGIGLDVTLACDTPGVPAQEMITAQGKGFGIHIQDASFIADYRLVDQLEALAEKHKIPAQRTILPLGGQDGAAAQQAAAGARAVGFTAGTRYIHTVAEMIDKRDLAAARDGLAAFLAEL